MCEPELANAAANGRESLRELLRIVGAIKVLSAGEKAKKVRDGYVLGVNVQDENNFQLIDKINVGNKPTDVVYQFQKVN